jgi:hypothetical protein
MDEEMPGASEEEKKDALSDIMAKARGESKKCEDCGKEECECDKEEAKGEGEEGEKKASIKAAILEKMAADPNYVSHLIAKHYPG